MLCVPVSQRPRGGRLLAVLMAVAASAVLVGCEGGASGPGADPAQAFAGRTVRMVVASPAGGGLDLYARVLAPNLARHLPGQPSVAIDNMTGAGGLIAATHVARRAAPDGLTIGVLNMQVVLARMLNDGVQFDARELVLVGSPASEGYVCAFPRESGFTLDAWRGGRAARLGITNLGSPTASYSLLVSAALDLPARTVGGYGGTADIRSAMASGEVDGTCLSRNSYLASFLPQDDYVPVLQGGADEEALLEGVPEAEALASSDRAKVLLAAARAVGGLSRFLALPPGTPEPIVSAVRAAFQKAVADPAFLAAAATARLEVSPRDAAALEAQIRDLLSLSGDDRASVIDVLGRGRR